ncbi:serine/threonine-protein kinase [Streptomyces roseoverticillatus]|uniref:non-specific serine/threonine protein kinase n=1 Tax=Streptomyces roseoverticillatus TaxID=66429 RepID=A0ABV3J3M8_9ACTN
MRDQLLGDRYRLVRQLGEGGMGQVWEAQDETLGRNVAVKVISLLAGGGSRGDEARARFLREARITAQLQHPNIVTIHDLGETGTGDNRVPFLVMELVRGEGLDAMLRRGVVTLADAARWGALISDALAVAHDAGIMHRDIKPSNILITPSGTVKVLDFGIARAADPYATADRLTQTGFIVGTPPYMAPEQARGLPEPCSDLYALGCLLFELITGQLPFQAPDTVGYLTAHLTQEPPAPSSVSPDISTAWDDLVLRLLHKDPAQRYPSAADLAQALRQLDRAPEPTPPTDESTPPTTVPFDVSWTGKEPPSTYTRAPEAEHERHWVKAANRAGKSLLVAAAAVIVAGERTGWGAGWGELDLWSGLLIFVVAVPAWFLFMLFSYLAWEERRLDRAFNNREGWKLHVGPNYLVTTSSTERREFTWDQIQRVTIEEIHSNSGPVHSGIHVELAPGVAPQGTPHPAGWPYTGGERIADRDDGRLPICVLGPMAAQQRTELNHALTMYGGQRWSTPDS